MNTTHTKGPWKALGLTVWQQNPDKGAQIQMVHCICNTNSGYAEEVNRANAALIAEAGTVAHETGKTPRQLAEENRELLEALKEIAVVEGPVRVENGALHFEDGTILDLCAIIDKAEGRG